MVGWQELLIVMIIVMLIFGTSKISGVGKAMGTAIRDFKDSMKSEPEPDKKVIDSKDQQTSEEAPKEAGKVK